MSAYSQVSEQHERIEGSVDDFCALCDVTWPCPDVVILDLVREQHEALRDMLGVDDWPDGWKDEPGTVGDVAFKVYEKGIAAGVGEARD